MILPNFFVLLITPKQGSVQDTKFAVIVPLVAHFSPDASTPFPTFADSEGSDKPMSSM
jgi:hypothetical protein